MKLRELLAGKNNVRIREIEKYGDSYIFVGGAYYNGKSILPLDGGFYPMEMKLEIYDWEDEETLVIVR